MSPRLTTRQWLALSWVFKDSNQEWFDDWPLLVTSETIASLIAHGLIEKSAKGRYRMTAEGLEHMYRTLPHLRNQSNLLKDAS